MKNNKKITGSKVILREKSLSDARNDYTWRIDPELAQLDAAPVLATSFAHYLLNYTNELRFPTSNSQRFAVDTADGKHIGNCVYYDINDVKGEAELGIMIGDRDYWNKGYGTDAVTTLVSHIFQETGLKRIYLKTLKSNKRAQKSFKKSGFNPCGYLAMDGYNFLLMEIQRKQWEKNRESKPE